MRAEDGINEITQGLIKAAMNLAAQKQRRAQRPDKRNYSKAGTMIHATKCLTAAQRAPIQAILMQMQQVREDETVERMQELMNELAKHPVKFVPVLRQIVPPTRPNRSRRWG